jgi:hypothetical protein
MRGWAAALILALAIVPGLVFGDVYYWVDENGIQNYTTRFESIPERYRPTSKPLPLPTSPPAPPDLPLSPPQKGPTKISFVPGSPVLVSAKINGAGPITLILDTGASNTMVSPSALLRLGVTIEGVQRGLLRGVTGASYADAVWVASIEVGEAKVGPLLVVAHDADLKGADGLLGRDFLASFNVTIDPKARIVTLAPD